MLLGILVVIMFFLEISIRLSGAEFKDFKNPNPPITIGHLLPIYNDRGYVLKYSSSFMETLDFFFVLIPTLLVCFLLYLAWL